MCNEINILLEIPLSIHRRWKETRDAQFLYNELAIEEEIYVTWVGKVGNRESWYF